MNLKEVELGLGGVGNASTSKPKFYYHMIVDNVLSRSSSVRVVFGYSSSRNKQNLSLSGISQLFFIVLVSTPIFASFLVLHTQWYQKHNTFFWFYAQNLVSCICHGVLTQEQ